MNEDKGTAEIAVGSHDTLTKLVFGDKQYFIVGTAHISQSSVDDVTRVIDEVNPDKICVELDQARYMSMTQADSWKSLDVFKVIKDGKGFMLLANLVLSSFQKRMGVDMGIKPGEEMREAIRLAEERNIPFALIDRNIQVTFQRAWSLSSLWGKNKLLAALIGSAFSTEKLTPEQIEELKVKSALGGMMDELAGYLPSVKHVLIDERDQHLACRMFEESGQRIVAVVGAGHVPGMVQWLNDLHATKVSSDISEIVTIPKKFPVGKILAWAIPIAIIGLVVLAFIHSGFTGGLNGLLSWWLIHGTLVALGIILAGGHPLTVILGFLGSPLGTFHIVGSVGILTGGLQAYFRKPSVNDLENLQNDITSLRGFYRNRVTRILLVFFLSSVGGVIGNLISIPAITRILGQ